MARRKKTALDVPASVEEARKLIEEYVAGERTLLDMKLGYAISIDELKSRLADLTAPVAAANQARFDAIKAWWEAGGKEVAGRARSAEVGGATLGIRLSPPKVKLAKGLKDKSVVAILQRLRWSRTRDFLRTKTELDKPAIIKAVQTDDEAAAVFAGKGVTVVQVDEFFIDTGLDEDAIRKELTASE